MTKARTGEGTQCPIPLVYGDYDWSHCDNPNPCPAHGEADSDDCVCKACLQAGCICTGQAWGTDPCGCDCCEEEAQKHA